MIGKLLKKKLSHPNSADNSLPPVLDLSGQKLRTVLESLLRGAEEKGGIEEHITTLKAKSALFKEALLENTRSSLNAGELTTLCAFMPTVRRRVSIELRDQGISRVNGALLKLTEGLHDTSSTDERIQEFLDQFPRDPAYRWVKDLAAETLHYIEPEKYPLMTRWVWDSNANTGVLRELWFGDDVDQKTITISDNYNVFLVLREELSMFLSQNGFYRDVNWYSDLLQAQTYAEYICSQGGTYLRADFSSPDDPMEHTRRMLGLDGAARKSKSVHIQNYNSETAS